MRRTVLAITCAALLSAAGSATAQTAAPARLPTSAAVSSAITASVDKLAPTRAGLATLDIPTLVQAIEGGIVSSGATPSIALQSLAQIDAASYPANMQTALQTEAAKLLQLLQADQRYTGGLAHPAPAPSGPLGGSGGGAGYRTNG